MHLFSIAAVAALIGVGSASLAFKFGEQEALAAKAVINIGLDVAKNGYASPKTCTLKNVAVRREWSTLLRSEKLNYIDAVKCLHAKPALTPSSIAAGAKNRFDDFVVTHVLQTYSVHATTNFLAWHRYYTWAYEQLLRNECSYKGYLPYYNWAWWSDPSKSPLLDGSDTSIGGDGEYIAGRNYTCVGPNANCYIKIQPGRGGGCIKSGPMAEYDNAKISTNARTTTDEPVAGLMLQGDFPNKYMGAHSAGHYIIGGDAVHHAQIDRVWWIWQNQDIKNRQNAIADTITFLNMPPSRNGTLNDPLTLGSMLESQFPNITQGDAMNTLAGPFCYIYA
ncbi:hypothetical protein OPT61_g814 [Boeremia exigua]|uniref:Uncharacterized protein n=1 Tax=Boeremia exigua TaxID=749465 RepID=A0ACC2ISR5_9PLEO|nr:hypothetical protein OPT61_g814 [Boeremia exigua]